MHKSKFLALLLAVAMVVSMVVVPAYAADEYTITLADAEGNTAVTVAPTEETLDLYLYVKNNPGFMSAGALIDIPDGWTLAAVADTSMAAATLNTQASALLDMSHGTTSYDPYKVNILANIMMGAGLQNGDGKIAKLTFNLPEEPSAEPYTFVVDVTTQANLNNVGSGTTLDVKPVNCQVTVSDGEEPAGPTCPECGALENGWEEVSTLPGALTTGHYKLTGNVDVTAALTVAAGQTVCIDLNGNNITAGAQANTTNYRVFENSGTLIILDSVGTGVVSGGRQSSTKNNDAKVHKGGNIYNYSGATFKLLSGIIDGGQLSCSSQGYKYYGGNIYGEAGSTIEIKGGTVKNGKFNPASTTYHNTSGGSWGANIYSEGTLRVSGGIITQDSAYTATMSNASNTNNGRPSYFHGHNIAVGSGATLAITGGTISNGAINFTRQPSASMNAGNTILRGGNIYASGATVTISGNAQIINGSLTATAIGSSGSTEGSDSGRYPANAAAFGGNIYVDDGSLTLTGEVTISGGSATATANNVTTVKTAKQATALADGGNIYVGGSCNVSIGKDANGKKPTISNGTVSASTTSTFTGNTGTADSHGGNIFFASERVIYYYTGTGTYNNTYAAFTGSADVEASIYNGSAELGGNICVFSPNSTEITLRNVDIYGGDSTGSGGNIHCRGTITIESGNIYNGTTDKYGGNIYTTVGATITMNGGNIYNGTAERGGNIYMMDSNDEFNMYGGEIYGGTATSRQRNVAVYGGDFNMYGGDVYASGKVNDGYSDCLYAQNEEAYINIYGGTVNGENGNYTGKYAVYAVYGNVYVEGGTIKGCEHAVAVTSADNHEGTAQIVGGTLLGNVYVADEDATATISGGTIDGYEYKAGTLKIQAGATLYEDPTMYLDCEAVAFNGETYKTFDGDALSDALTKAQNYATANGSVTLGKDIAVNDDLVLSVTKLDLNGKTLTVKGDLEASMTNIVDASGDASITVEGENVATSRTNEYLPVSVDGAVKLLKPTNYNKGSQNNAGNTTKKFAFYLNGTAAENIVNAIDKEEVTLQIRLLKGNEKVGTYVVPTEILEQYAVEDWANKVIMVTATGAEADAEYSIEVICASASGTIYTTAYAED